MSRIIYGYPVTYVAGPPVPERPRASYGLPVRDSTELWTIAVTPSEYNRLRPILESGFISPEGRDELRARAAEILGPGRMAVVTTAERYGEYADLVVDWSRE